MCGVPSLNLYLFKLSLRSARSHAFMYWACPHRGDLSRLRFFDKACFTGEVDSTIYKLHMEGYYQEPYPRRSSGAGWDGITNGIDLSGHFH